MTLDIALALDHSSVRLLRCAGGCRTELGALRLDDPRFDARLADLRHGVCGEDVDVEIVLPPSLVLFLDVGEVREDELEARVAKETPCAIDDLILGRNGALAAAVERTTLEEARDFARAHGFRPAAFAAQPGNDADDVVAFRYEPLPPPAFRSHRMTAETEPAGPPTTSSEGEVVDASTEHSDEAAPGAIPAPPEPIEATMAATRSTDTDEGTEPGMTPVTPHMPLPPVGDRLGANESAGGPVAAAPATPLAGENAAQPAFSWRTTRPRDVDDAVDRSDRSASPEPEQVGPGGPSPDDLPEIVLRATEEGTEALRPETAEETKPQPTGTSPDDQWEVPLAFRRRGQTADPEATSPRPESKERRDGRAAAPVITASGRKAGPAAVSSLTTPRVAPARSEAEALTVFGARGGSAPTARGFTLLHAAAAALAAGVLFAAYGLFQGDVAELHIVSLEEVATNAIDPLTQAADGTARGADASALSDEPEVEVAALEPTTLSTPTPRRPEIPPAERDAAIDAPSSELATPVVLPEPIRLETPKPLPSPVLPAQPDIAAPGAFTPPPPPGTVFDMDERGLVRPTEEGALTPHGVLVHSGPPATLPPATALGRPVDPPSSGEEVAGTQDDAAVPPAEEGPAVTAADIPRVRPPARPEDAIAAPVVIALAAGEDAPRPTFRPESVERAVTSAASPNAATDFDAMARRAQTETATAGATIASVAPRAAEPPPPEPEGRANVTVQPSLPTRASVADRATVQNALRLNRVNLIGVYGTSSDRRALIRLPTGRYVKVKVGDRVDGGRVASIQNSRVEYVKGGRRYDLSLPSG